MSTCTKVTFVLVGLHDREHLVEHGPAVLRGTERGRREQHRHRLPGAHDVGQRDGVQRALRDAGADRLDAEGRRPWWATPPAAPAGPGPAPTAVAGSVIENFEVVPLKLASPSQIPACPNVARLWYTPRPLGSPARSSTIGIGLVQVPSGPLNRTCTGGPLTYLMPPAPPCWSTSVNRCGSGEA